MTSVDLSRIQFAFTSMTGVPFVPITIELAFFTVLPGLAVFRSRVTRRKINRIGKENLIWPPIESTPW